MSLCQMTSAALPLEKGQDFPDLNRENREGRKDSFCLFPGANSREGASGAFHHPMDDPAWPRPPGLRAHTLAPTSLLPSALPGTRREAPAVFFSKSSRGSHDHRRHGGPRPRALAGEEGDLRGGDRGQGEGRGGVGPENPVQQLLLLLLELLSQLGLLLQGLAGEKQVLRELS